MRAESSEFAILACLDKTGVKILLSALFYAFLEHSSRKKPGDVKMRRPADVSKFILLFRL